METIAIESKKASKKISKKIVVPGKCKTIINDEIQEKCGKKCIVGKSFCVDHIENQDQTNKCNGLTGTMNRCTKNKINDTNYCKVHQYMNEYTQEMLTKMKKCSSCRMAKYTGEFNTCDDCRKTKPTDEKKSISNDELLCKFCNKFKAKENGYCGNHQIEHLKELAKLEGQKYCRNIERKCRNLLDINSKNSKCEECRKKDNDRHKMKLDQLKQKNQNNDEDNDENNDENNEIIYEDRMCSKHKRICKIQVGRKTCDLGLQQSAISNNKKKEKNNKRPDCKYPNCKNKANDNIECGGFCKNHVCYMDPHKWNQVADKNTGILCSCGNYRKKESFIVNGVQLKRCKICRDQQEVVDNKRESRNERWNSNDDYRELQRSAKRRNKTFEMSKEKMIELQSKPCTYCGEIEDIGIDRVDNDIGYNDENTTPACKFCNNFKKDHTVEDFLKYCKNIHINIGTHEKSNKNRENRSYSKYVYDAKRRNIKFELSELQFNRKLQYKCYYCADTNCNSIGIDRIDSDGNYTNENTVPACKICNLMKKEYDIIFFYEQIKKILFHNKIIDNAEKKINIKNSISSLIIEALNTIYNVDIDNSNEKEVLDHRNICVFDHDEKYYADMIYNTYDINNFEPELEFCETDDQKQIWLYYRLRVSSHPYTNSFGRCVKILIRDKLTKKYVGITSLSSIVKNCGIIGDYIGWSAKNKFEDKRINNIMDISTCVGLQPFSYNYNGGKLIAMLMFSREVYDYVMSKFNDPIAAITTFSLHGKSIQYDRLKQLKYIGLTEGYGASHIPDKLYDKMIKYLHDNKINIKNLTSKMHIVSKFCKCVGIRDVTKHGKKRGTYFGPLGTKWKEYLTCMTDTFDPDMLVSVDEIFNEWKNKWAMKRFNHLIENNRIQLDYYFINYTNDKEYTAYRVRKSLEKKQNNNSHKTNDDRKYVILSISDKIEIIKYWYNNKDSYTNIAKAMTQKLDKKIDSRTISSLVNL